MRAARNFVNTAKGGYLFGPDVAAADHAKTLHVDAMSGTHLLLLSDGFLALASDYGRYDIAGLLTASVEKGLRELARELREIEDADPEGRTFPRFKKCDDATAVLLKMVG